ncbi:MAG: hypothetical protein ACYDEV_13240 [Acidiferrobacter sp.]
MSLRILVSAALLTLTIAPAFAVNSHIQADRAALSAARVALHKDYVNRYHDRHSLYLARHHHNAKLIPAARHKIVVDEAAIRRDSAALHRARVALHRDSVALHHPALHHPAPTHS